LSEPIERPCPHCNKKILITLGVGFQTAGRLAEERGVHVMDREAPITDRQKAAIYAIAKRRGIPFPSKVGEWTRGQASDWIRQQDAAERRG
jgi:glutathione synthase/RimK-type ligase-like ATP-grasp enzyme